MSGRKGERTEGKKNWVCVNREEEEERALTIPRVWCVSSLLSLSLGWLVGVVGCALSTTHSTPHREREEEEKEG